MTSRELRCVSPAHAHESGLLGFGSDSRYPPDWRPPLLGIARIMLYCAGALIAMGGLYDVFVPRLPSNLVALCAGNQRACKLVRELLRALGGSLLAVGTTVAFLVSRWEIRDPRRTLMLVLLLVLPSEGINSLSMYRVGSPFLVPVAFTLLTLLGVLLAWPGLFY